MSKAIAKIGNVEIVFTPTDQIIMGDTLWIRKQTRPCGPLHFLVGRVVDECDDGSWDVRASGATVNVKHGEIVAVEFTGDN